MVLNENEYDTLNSSLFINLRHQNLQEGCGHSLAPNVAPDSGHFLLLLHPCHVISGDHGTIDDGGRG